MGGRHFGVHHLLINFVDSGRKKSPGFFGGGDRFGTPVVADMGLVLDSLNPSAGFSLVRGVGLVRWMGTR